MVNESDRGGGAGETDPRLASSPVVTDVFTQVLDDVISGDLQPGQRISDAQLAERFGVSRTPVREALQRLREIGVIEASASRFTRVAEVSPRQTAQAFAVWLPLFATLVDEVVPTADPAALPLLEAQHAEYVAAVAALGTRTIAATNFRFFTAMHDLSSNPILRRALVSVVHIVRLGSLHLPDYIDFELLGAAQSALIDALRTRDADRGRAAVELLRRIQVPQA